MVTTPKDISDQLKALIIPSSQVKTTGEFGKEIGRGAYGSVFTVKYCRLICAGVTGICVSQGCVFPAHISLGMRVSPHTYH